MSFLNFWKRGRSSARRRAGGKRGSGCPQFTRLRLEPLEERRLLASWYPTDPLDNDPNYVPKQLGYAKPITLRDCILQANYDYSSTRGQVVDIIYLLGATTYTLSTPNPSGPDAGGYALCITGSMKIVGDYSRAQGFKVSSIIQQTQQDRVFEILPSAGTVYIGDEWGGTYGPLVIEDGHAVDQPNPTGPANGPDYALGGGIYDDGATLWLYGVEIMHNSALGANGTAAAPNGQPGMGGGIYCCGKGGQVQLNDSTVSGNTAWGGGGASGAGDTPAGNGGMGQGGGIYCSGSGGVAQDSEYALGSSYVTGNYVWGGDGGAGGGGQALPGAGGEADGGGLCIDGSSTQLFTILPQATLVVTGNTAGGGDCGRGTDSGLAAAGGAAQGGGIFVGDSALVSLADPSISSNKAFAGVSNLGNTNNSYGATGAANGGGIFAENAEIVLDGGVVSNNRAEGAEPGGIAGADGGLAFGGGIGLEGQAKLFMDNTLITLNSALGGPGWGSTSGEADSALGGAAEGGGLAIAALGRDSSPYFFTNGANINHNLALGGAGGNGAAAAGSNAGAVGGNAAGGGVYDTAGTVSLYDFSVAGNTAKGGAGGNGAGGGNGGQGGYGSGGGIYDGGVLAGSDGPPLNVTITNNVAQGGAGGNGGSNGGGGGYGEGGGMYYTTNIDAPAQTFMSFTITSNVAQGGGAGAGNSAGGPGGGGDGGGLLADGSINLQGCTLGSNKAIGAAGGAGASGSIAGNGGNGGGGCGGGLCCLAGNISLSSPMVTFNSAKGGVGGSGGWCSTAGGTGGEGGEGGQALGGAVELVGQPFNAPPFVITLSPGLALSNVAQGGAGGAGGQGGNGEAFGSGPGPGGQGGPGGEADGGFLFEGDGFTVNLAGGQLLFNSAQGGAGAAGGPGGAGPFGPSGNGAMGAGGPGADACAGGAYVQAGAILNISSSSLIENLVLGGPAGRGNPAGSKGTGTHGQYYSEPWGTINLLSHVIVIGGN